MIKKYQTDEEYFVWLQQIKQEDSDLWRDIECRFPELLEKLEILELDEALTSLIEDGLYSNTERPAVHQTQIYRAFIM